MGFLAGVFDFVAAFVASRRGLFWLLMAFIARGLIAAAETLQSRCGGRNDSNRHIRNGAFVWRRHRLLVLAAQLFGIAVRTGCGMVMIFVPKRRQAQRQNSRYQFGC